MALWDNMRSPRYTLGPAPAVLGLPAEDEQRPPPTVKTGQAVMEEARAEAVEVEAVLDPPGRVVEIDGRVLSERLMFSFGFNGSTYQEIAEEFAASVLWVEVAIRGNPWLGKAMEAGEECADRDRVKRSVQAVDKLIKGYTTTHEVVNKTTGSVETLHSEVGPSTEMVKKVLESRARDKYGKDSKPVEVTITLGAFESALERARGAVRVEHTEVEDG